MTLIPSSRIHSCNSATVNGNGAYVLYWMIAYRRRQWNFALQRAVQWATDLRKPLLIVEALSCDYRWASTRIHTAILSGMRDNLQAFERSAARYHPFVERLPSEGKGMIEALARDACTVVTDDFPAFEIPSWIRTAAAEVRVRFEKIDSNGIFPMHTADRAFSTAHRFRRFLQNKLPEHLETFPLADPLADIDLPRLKLPMCLAEQWRAVTRDEIASPSVLAQTVGIDHTVGAVESRESGPFAARHRLRTFLLDKLASYADARNHPDSEASSALSSHLHFGHLSAHEVFHGVMKAVRWSPAKLALRATGSRENWWGAGINAEAFLEQLVTWRELGFNACVFLSDFDRYASLPDWARKTLARHATDRRPIVYSPEQFENAESTTHYGTLRRGSFFVREAFTTISECCGERKFWNGLPHLKKRWQR